MIENNYYIKNHFGSIHILRFLVHSSRNEYLKAALKVLRPIRNSFDCIAFSGMSGALIAPILAEKLNKELIMVRKPGDKRHSFYNVEGFSDVENYIIVDDFTESGATIKRIKKHINKIFHRCDSQPKCIGFLAVQELKGVSSYERTGLMTV